MPEALPVRSETAAPGPMTHLDSRIQVSNPGFESVLSEVRELHRSKARDYGTNADPWANLRAGEPYGIPAWVHASVMVDHKSNRIQSFVTKGELQHESVRDSLLDRAVYALAALVLFDES